MLIFMVSKMEDEYPIVECWKGPTYKGGGFPCETHEEGRRDEIDRLVEFEVVEDINP